MSSENRTFWSYSEVNIIIEIKRAKKVGEDMQRIFGDRKRIDLGSSEFRGFIESGRLYIDKTRFIEHAINEESRVLLFTRPRRTGKSLNLDMLRTFLDINQDSKELFKGLYIESSPVFEKINSAPVIYLNFKEMRADDYKKELKESLIDTAHYYLHDEQLNHYVQEYSNDNNSNSTSALLRLIESISHALGNKPYVLIDEYDKLLMDNINSPEYEDIRKWLQSVFESALKDNPHLEKGIMVGITKVSLEGISSGFNNIYVFDVFTTSDFDGDFSLTEEEVSELLDEDQLDHAREWYDNYRVGNMNLFFLFSVLSYMDSGILDNYWGMSGSMNTLMDALTSERVDAITDLLSTGKEIETTIERRMSLQQLKNNNISNSSFYSFAVQTGYLTYELDRMDGYDNIYKLRIPNLELSHVWRDFILSEMLKSKHTSLRDIFKGISETEEFSVQFQEFVSFQLSSFDIGKELEKTYHVLVFGLILGAGYKCSSNRERGYGRYDLWLEGPDFNVIIEFKRAKKETDDLEKLALEAIGQIDKRKYYAKFPGDMPLYKVGVGCYKTECHVMTILHEM